MNLVSGLWTVFRTGEQWLVRQLRRLLSHRTPLTVGEVSSEKNQVHGKELFPLLELNKTHYYN